MQQLLHNLPWFHLCTIIDKAVDYRDWYARAAGEYGWSRAILVMQIETSAHERFGKAKYLPPLPTSKAPLLSIDLLSTAELGDEATRRGNPGRSTSSPGASEPGTPTAPTARNP